jgi:hypothetical protein
MKATKQGKRGVSPIFKKKYITSGVTLMIRQKSLQFRVRKKELSFLWPSSNKFDQELVWHEIFIQT